MYVGWDWASETHDVTVLDSAGEVVDRWALHPRRGRHRRRSIRGWPATASPAELPVTIERGARRWWWTGCWRPATRWCRSTPTPSTPPARAGAPPGRSPTPATATSWPTTCAPTGTGCAGWTPLTRAPPSCRRWCALRDDHVAAKVAATNQLRRSAGARTGPAPSRVFARLDTEIALAFLTDYPTPQRRRPARRRPHGGVLPPPPYRGGDPPAELLARLRGAPRRPGRPRPTTSWPASSAPRSQLLRTLLGHHRRARPGHRTALLRAHPRPHLLAPLPRVGQHQPRPTPRRGRPDPRPGRRRRAGRRRSRRRAGHQGLRQDQRRLLPLGRQHPGPPGPAPPSPTTAATHRPGPPQLYADARARGKRHPHAIRILARAWLRVIWACWHTNTAYDPGPPPRRTTTQPRNRRIGVDSGNSRRALRAGAGRRRGGPAVGPGRGTGGRRTTGAPPGRPGAARATPTGRAGGGSRRTGGPSPPVTTSPGHAGAGSAARAGPAGRPSWRCRARAAARKSPPKASRAWAANLV